MIGKSIDANANENTSLAFLLKTLIISTLLFCILLAMPQGEFISFVCGLSAIIITVNAIYWCFSFLGEALSQQNRSKWLCFAAIIPLVNTIILFNVLKKSSMKNGLGKRLLFSFLGTIWFSAIFIIALSIFYAVKNNNNLEQPIEQPVAVSDQPFITSKTLVTAIKEPVNARFHYNRGLAYFNENKFELAVEELNKAIKLDSNLDKAYSLRAACYGSLNKFEEALLDVNKAIQLNPNDYMNFITRGGILIEMGNIDAGLKDIKTALKLNPSEKIRNLEKNILEKLGRGEGVNRHV